MCSGTLPNPRNWNRELHDIAGCDHDSPTARRLDSFLNDFVMFRHYNRAAEPLKPTTAFEPRVIVEPLPPIFTRSNPVETHPLKRFIAPPVPSTIKPLETPVGCHKPDFLGHEQPDPKVDLDAVKQFIGGICAEVVPCKFKFFTRPGYCTGFWVRQHGRQIEHFENESDAKAKCDLLNRVPDGTEVAPPIDLPPVEVRPRVRGLASLRRSWRVR